MKFQTLYIIFALCVMLPAEILAQSIPVDGYAAMVNDRIITVGDVMGFIQPVEMQLRETYQGRELEEQLEKTFSQGRESLIDRALILEDFEAQEGFLPDRVVDEHISEIIRERFDSDRAAFLGALAEQRITLQEWTEQVKERLIVIVSRRQNVSERTIISPKAVHDVYKERMDEYRIPAKTHIRMIVINKGTTDEDIPVKKAEADGVVQKLKDGADFATLAEDMSEGSKASKGGDWGWIEPSALREELAEVALQLAVGEHSDAIEAGDIYYILKLEAKQDATVTPFEDARAKIEAELRLAEQERLYERWLKRLRKKHYVKIF